MEPIRLMNSGCVRTKIRNDHDQTDTIKTRKRPPPRRRRGSRARNKWMPGALGQQQPVAHLPPTPCSAGDNGYALIVFGSNIGTQPCNGWSEKELPAQFALIERLTRRAFEVGDAVCQQA